MDSLRYYIAHNGGLEVMENRNGSLMAIGEFFAGKNSRASHRLREKA